MVSRLVEQQKIRVANQRLRERDPAAPTAGEFADPRVRGKLESREHLIHPLAETPAVARLDLVLQKLHPLQLRRIFGHRMRHMMKLCEQPANVREALCHHIEDRRIHIGGQILREPCNGERRLAPDFAAFGDHLTIDNLQQGRLARAVAPDQAHPLAGLDLQTRVFQHGLPPEGEGHMIEAE